MMLQVNDPLRNKVVSIAAQVLPHEGDEANRPVLVSVGMAGQKPVMLKGTLGTLQDTVMEAWRTHSQVTLAAPQAEEEVIAEGPLVSAAVQPSLYSENDF